MEFDFFAAELPKIRKYRSMWPYWHLVRDFLGKPRVSGTAELISIDDGGSDIFQSTHLSWPPTEEKVDLVEAGLGVQLPEDYRSFFENWGQALLVCREAYWIMPPSDVLAATNYWRDEVMGSTARCNVIRFARFWDNEERHFCFIRSAEGWKVGFRDDYVFPTDDDDVTGEEADSCITDPDFRSWLTRMIETDGTPWFPGADDEAHCRTTRLP